jgi:heat shock protein HslJ
LATCTPDTETNAFFGSLNQVTSFTAAGNNLELGLSGEGQIVSAPSTPLQLVGPLWRLTAYNNSRDGLDPILEWTQPTAVFEASGLVTGSGGCNMYSAAISSTTTTTVSIGPIAAARIVCEETVMDQERAYLTALERTSTYHIEGSRRALVDRGGVRQAEYSL